MDGIAITDKSLPVYLIDIYDKRSLLHNADWRDDLIDQDYTARLYLTMSLKDAGGRGIDHTSPVAAVTIGGGLLSVETEHSVYTFYTSDTSYTSDTKDTT